MASVLVLASQLQARLPDTCLAINIIHLAPSIHHNIPSKIMNSLTRLVCPLMALVLVMPSYPEAPKGTPCKTLAFIPMELVPLLCDTAHKVLFRNSQTFGVTQKVSAGSKTTQSSLVSASTALNLDLAVLMLLASTIIMGAGTLLIATAVAVLLE
jgi:hypothetical protein